MDKKLPKVFANKTNKDFKNNEKVFYSKDEKEIDDIRTSSINNNPQTSKNIGVTKNIYQKINDIFNSERYVYKADVQIKTTKGNINTKVIGKNHTHLITIDNELISISEIEDISFLN